RPGSGKTTTAYAFVLDRLRKFGGTAWTVENPIEFAKQGQHGKGWLYQTEVDDDEQIGPEIRELYRLVPNILFVGEVRDARAMKEIVRAAGSGYLVVFTFFGNDLANSIGQASRLASADKSTDVNVAFAEVLRAMIYLELQVPPVEAKVRETAWVGDDEPTGHSRQLLVASPLFI
ncbi:ATPase, T2SS/T4P/T4SS family, partial [Paraburkholderia caledonica]|uniref:ATPase, T2SS/T4P/T4SS family n=1 Tax=Paraburkholderia caledonica TaxID=134536 RepID=UPI0015C65642